MIDAAGRAGAPSGATQDHVTVETVAGVTPRSAASRSTSTPRRPRRVRAEPRGGVATGGYASGLAAALVFGRIAARAALGGAA